MKQGAPAVSLPWKLPIPSTSFVKGPRLNPGFESELTWSYEGDSEFVRDFRRGTVIQTLTFCGVVAYKCSYGFSCGSDLVKTAYDSLVDLGGTDWLRTVRAAASSDPSTGGECLKHVAIFFDEGPCYEFICKEAHLSEEFSPRPDSA